MTTATSVVTDIIALFLVAPSPATEKAPPFGFPVVSHPKNFNMYGTRLCAVKAEAAMTPTAETASRMPDVVRYAVTAPAVSNTDIANV